MQKIYGARPFGGRPGSGAAFWTDRILSFKLQDQGFSDPKGGEQSERSGSQIGQYAFQ